MCTTAFSQFNYRFTNTRQAINSYTDISGTGISIEMTNPESGTSVAPLNIGFNFNFNGTLFTECMIHADGILRFGTSAPGSHTALFTNNASAGGSVFTSANSSYQNVVFALFMDLVQGNTVPAYHLLTEGVAPNRVTTVQWSNLKDNNNSGTTTQNQFDNLEFQVKLYETSNDIQIVYGDFAPSANIATGRNAVAGIKASGTLFTGVKKSNSINPFSISEFFDPGAHAVFNAGLPIRKTAAPPKGFSYIFYGMRTFDVSIAEAYVDRIVPKSAAASLYNRVRIRNEGTAVLTDINVTMQITGVNTFSQAINIAILSAGAEQVVDFSGYNNFSTGDQSILFTVAATGDERPENNTALKIQSVSNSFAQPLADTENQVTGIGFNGSANNEIAIKMYGTGTRKISQIRVPFGSYISNASFKILEDDGIGNIPGTLLHTSTARNTNFDNETIYNLPAPVTVVGDYYISIRQNNTENMAWQFALQYPIHPNRIFNGNFSTYTVQLADRGFHPLIKVVEESNQPDVGIVAVSNPVCTYNNSAAVTVSLRNYSSAVHDFAINPVTVSGSVINDKTNTPVTFSVTKNTGTLSAGAIEPVTVLATYDFNERASHRFIAKTEMAGDAEPKNDSLSYLVVNSLRHTKSFTDSVCPFTTVTITSATSVFSNIQWNVNGLTSSGNSVSLAPSQTSVVKVTATDYRGCTISDSIIVPVRVIGLPPEPLISFNDTLLSYRNGFSDTLSVSSLADHTVNWQGSGTVINGGLSYVVSGFRGQNPESHLAFYRNTTTGCGSKPSFITTRFAPGILMNNNNNESLCDTSFYDSGDALGINQGNDNFTKTFFPSTPGSKVRLSIYNVSLGQFSTMNIYDGTSTSASRLDQLDRFATNTLREYIASNNDGAITVSFRANSSTGSGWLAAIKCETPLQFRSVQNGLFTDINTWESKLPTVANYTPATRRPFKGDDTIYIRHAVSLSSNFTLPLDQTVIEPAGTLSVPANSSIGLYTDNPGYELTVNGTLTVDGNIFGSPNSSLNGKIALAGTLNLKGQIVIDSVVAIPAATQAVINASGTALISKLQVNNPFGVNINGNLDVSRVLDLKNGLLNVAATNFIRLVAGEGPVLQGGSANSYVNGKMRWQSFSTSDPLVFAVGKNGIYRRIELLTNQTSFDDKVEYEAELITGVPPARTMPGTFTNINQQWYHTISITSGSSFFSNATATIYYEATDGIANPSALRIGKDDGGTNWIDIGGTGSGSPAGSITSNSFTSFSDFVLANLTGGTLPVTLISFKGNLLNNAVQLNWKVENETQLEGYQVERSTNGTVFTKIGFVATGTVSTSTNYQYNDLQLPIGGEIYYRLKMVDKDGRFKYSNIIRLKQSGQLNNRVVTIAPNPFINSFVIQIQSGGNQNIQVQLLDIGGKVLLSKKYVVNNGINQLYFQTGNLPGGMYLIKLITPETVITEKLIKN